MKYNVAWKSHAENQLAEIWLTAADRNAVKSAADSLDRQLARDPWSMGESRSGTTRIAFEPPLAIVYEIVEDDRRVTVLALRRF